MGETIEFEIRATGFRNDAERDSLETFCNDWLDTAVDMDVSGEEVFVNVGEGWRGAGITCQKLVQNALSNFVRENSHIKGTVYCKHVEYPPVEEFRFGNGHWLVDEGDLETDD